jgi:hypothetical protein
LKNNLEAEKMQYQIKSEQRESGSKYYRLILSMSAEQREKIIEALKDSGNDIYLKEGDHWEDLIDEDSGIAEMDIDSGMAIKKSIESLSEEWADRFCENLMNDLEYLNGIRV